MKPSRIDDHAERIPRLLAEDWNELFCDPKRLYDAMVLEDTEL